MTNRLLALCAVLLVIAVPCEAQGTEQQDSLAVLQQKVVELETQLEQMVDLILRLESRLQLQEQRTVRGLPSTNHQHRPMEISNFDNEVLRVVRGRCTLTQIGTSLTLTCR